MPRSARVNSAHKALAARSRLLLLALAGVLVVAIHCGRRSGDAGLEPVTKTEPNAATVVTNPGPEPVTKTKPSAAPIVKRNPVRVSDYEARRRELIERWESTRTKRRTATSEQQDHDGTPATAPRQ
jgi:hypothetical protein